MTDKGDSSIGLPVVSGSTCLLLLRVSLATLSETVASEANSRGPVEYQNISFIHKSGILCHESHSIQNSGVCLVRVKGFC